MTAASPVPTKRPKVRIDPVSRPLDGALPWTEIKGKDPARYYVLVNERMGGEFDVSYYAGLAEGIGVPSTDGYQVEIVREGGPRFSAGGGERGEPIRWRGMILMSCPKSFKELLEEVGDDGHSGQRSADERDRQYKRKGAYDDLRGIASSGISLERADKE